MNASRVLLLLILIFIATTLIADAQVREDYLEWGLQLAPKPEWMPPLEEYKPLVESFINTSECQAKINYVGVYFNNERAHNDSLGVYVFYLQVFDLLKYRALSMLINDRNLAGVMWLGTSDDLMHGVIVSRSPIFLIELDEDLFVKGYLFAKAIYVRLNETHIGNLTAFMHTTQFPAGVTNFTVYCPASQLRIGLSTTVTETEILTTTTSITETVITTYSTTIPLTLVISTPYTITKRETYTYTYSYPVTETTVIEKTKTVTETANSLTTITELETLTITITETQTHTLIPALVIALLVGLIIGWVYRKNS
ncbi:MAG: hypothetical protein QXP68_06050 [Thermosphaera sp.]|uniref:hypothetical protein n=1 Tax=Thermofilum sp. TaxID=1961369 RepID=UPI003163DC91